MSVNAVVGIVLGVAVVFLAGWLIFGSKKRAWYKVYLANNDVMLLYRDLNERWRTSDRYMRFKNELGDEVTFPSSAHWILFWESIPEGGLEVAKDEIKRIKETVANKEP